MNAKQLGILLKRLRKLKSMTQQELGDALGVAKNTISYYERGAVANIPRENLKKLDSIFGVDCFTTGIIPPEYEELVPTNLTISSCSVDGCEPLEPIPVRISIDSVMNTCRRLNEQLESIDNLYSDTLVLPNCTIVFTKDLDRTDRAKLDAFLTLFKHRDDLDNFTSLITTIRRDINQ